jgi:cyclophilin family peptidyl-prolyl cis-trans isomerase
MNIKALIGIIIIIALVVVGITTSKGVDTEAPVIEEVLGTEVEEVVVEALPPVIEVVEETPIQEIMPEETTNQPLPKAVFETSAGSFTLELAGDLAPITVANFVKLAKEGYYNDTRFHRIIGNFMIQGGDSNTKGGANSDVFGAEGAWGTGGPGYAIEDEFGEGLSNVTGTISMANSGPNTGGSQFFINVVDNIQLDADKEPFSSKHPVFGHVVEGMDIVMALSQVATEPGDRPVEEVVVMSVTIQ